MSPIRSGARLAISYGYIPCALGLCGPQDKKRKGIINRFLKGSRKPDAEIKKILQDFKGAYPYYKLIARSNGIKDPLRASVVEAYWLGNSLLANVKTADFKKMMREEFLPLGHMPENKINDLPVKAIAYHSFHVLHVGTVTGRFKETQSGLDLCRVSWGKVQRIKKEELTVERQPLEFKKKISLAKPVMKGVRWNKDILPEVSVGDWVSIHWNTAIEKLDRNRLEDLKKYTQKVLRAVE